MLRRRRFSVDITPDDIFLDAENLPQFDTQQFEGRIERPISKYSIAGFFVASTLLIGGLAWKTAELQITRGEGFLARSEGNTLRHIPIFAERGLIFDRNGLPLAWNGQTHREYADIRGLAHVLGYTGKPNEKELDRYHPDQLLGRSGAERAFNEELIGRRGLRIVETDVHGNEVSAGIFEPAEPGSDIHLSIDARVQERFFSIIRDLAEERNFSGGAGVIMDLRSGEIVALASYPEFDSEVLAAGDDSGKIAEYSNDPRTPFLNRAISGVYTPGSIVKPFVGLGALVEGVITPLTRIVSIGYISIPNPFNPGNDTRFTDWKAHGSVAIRDAIAVSSNVFFYEVGGGYGNQRGIGIRGIEKYMRLFGFGSPTGIELAGEAEGVIPTPEWKAVNFPNESWSIGDTYHTAIGQFGFGVTVLQMARGVGALATGGTLVTPHVLRSSERERGGILDILRAELADPIRHMEIELDPDSFEVIQEGMRQAVTGGTASGLSGLPVRVAAKTGTAELGESKQRVNSWVTGYFPHEEPRYSFAVVMERGSRSNTIGGVYVMRQLLEWMSLNTPEYIR